MIHPALALFAQRTRIPTSARSIGFCVIWVCISSSSSGKSTRNNALASITPLELQTIHNSNAGNHLIRVSLHVDNSHERFLRNVHRPHRLHALFALSLLLEQFLLPGNITAIALRKHVLAHRRNLCTLDGCCLIEDPFKVQGIIMCLDLC